jgi:hypothetical protein
MGWEKRNDKIEKRIQKDREEGEERKRRGWEGKRGEGKNTKESEGKGVAERGWETVGEEKKKLTTKIRNYGRGTRNNVIMKMKAVLDGRRQGGKR